MFKTGSEVVSCIRVIFMWVLFEFKIDWILSLSTIELPVNLQ